MDKPSKILMGLLALILTGLSYVVFPFMVLHVPGFAVEKIAVWIGGPEVAGIASFIEFAASFSLMFWVIIIANKEENEGASQSA